MSRLYCSTYAGLRFKYGAKVGDPDPATNAEVFPPRPGGGRIPPAVNGPACAQVKLAKLVPGVKEQRDLSKVLTGVLPPSSVAVNGVVARLITSLSGFRAKET